MRWLVADSLYCPEALFCSHLDSYLHYLREAGEKVGALSLGLRIPGSSVFESSEIDVLFMLDRYDLPTRAWGKRRIAQVAAACSPMPWEVKDADGAPMYHLVVSSIPWMVEASRMAGVPAVYMPLAFDTRARVCGMGVKREKKAIFIGTTGANHRRRTELLADLRDIVEVLPPVFGRDYFRALAGAKVVFNVHAEWARGAANNMRMYEALGMGCALVTDGDPNDEWAPEGCWYYKDADEARADIEEALRDPGAAQQGSACVLTEHTYESRIPHLVELARGL